MADANPVFQWDDPFLLAEQLGEEERMVQALARDYAQEKLLPRIVEAYAKEKTEPAIFAEMGALGLLGATVPAEYGGAGASYVAYGLIAREIERVDSGYRSMMSVQSSLVMYPILAYGDGSAEAQIPAAAGEGRCDRLLRPDRGRRRLRSRRDAHARRKNRRRLSAEGRQDLDLQCADRRRVRRLGEVGGARGRDQGIRAGERREGPLRAQDRGQAVAARFSHRRDRARQCRSRRGGATARRCWSQGSVRLLEPGALRHRLGRDGRGGRLLDPRAPIWARAQAVRPAARQHAIVPEEARRHADRDRARASGGAQGRAAVRRGQAWRRK